MVFKPFHLSRQSFGKALSHGYYQSVVAAAQSSQASSTTFVPFGNHKTSRFSHLSGPKLHNAFQTSSTSSAKSSQLSTHGTGDSGLAAYYAAWQQHSGDEDAQWKQFKFPLRIGWRESKGKEKEETVEQSHQQPNEPQEFAQARHYEVKDTQDIEEEVQPNGVQTAEAFVPGKEEVAQAERAATPPITPTQKPAVLDINIDEPTGDLLDAQSKAYAEHLTKLQSSERYAEIPAVFESMLVAGIKPMATAYNSLIAAAINLPAGKHQTVLKVLDVYADMLRRKVIPDMVTYTMLVEFLSSNAISISAMKQSLEVKRTRYGGMEEAGKFMFPSNELECDILAEDNSLSDAIRFFHASAVNHKDRVFAAETYELLITACAEQGQVVEMIRIYADIDSGKVIPTGATFVPMIKAFSLAGDLTSAVECYNEYKALAIASDSGEPSVTDRKDAEVYAAVVKGYLDCGKVSGAEKFWEKVVDSYGGLADLQQMKSEIISKAFVPGMINNGLLADALKWAEELEMQTESRNEAMAKICVAAADNDNAEVATTAFQSMTSGYEQLTNPCMSLLAHFIRHGNVEEARQYWTILATPTMPVDASFIEPTAMYTVALIGSGQVEEGLLEARMMFARIRSSADGKTKEETLDRIDEGLGLIIQFLNKKSIALPVNATMDLMWTMVENECVVPSTVGQLLAGVGPESISQMNLKDLTLTLELQAGMILRGPTIPDVAASARFGRLFEALLSSGMPIADATKALIGKTLNIVGSSTTPYGRPDLAQQWHSYMHPPVEEAYTPVTFTPTKSYPASIVAPSTYEDGFDPYGANTDYKGSSMIVDELERSNNKSSSSRLNEALTKLRNIRRAGRHPRYITYAKLISAAAREERSTLVQDILGMARQDVPLLPQYRAVRYGWTSILDSMVGACLTLGNRSLAGQYHQELLDMGAAPTANTYGLYITTLKETAKTFDEASEAVKIFHRAKSEGVEPSSFLYNALIGKLGKARRIDDCLFYFGEMRGLGIRPTSVTYGTIVNALCRVSDERFAEDLFEEMETMPNYKPRPAPYNSLMQFFLTTKRDKGKVLAYYERMKARNIQPTMHTYKLLVDAHATLEPTDMAAAEAVLETIRKSGQQPEAVHFASLIHAKGCVMHDMGGARKVFDKVFSETNIRPQACLYQALFEAMVANHRVADTEVLLKDMAIRRVEMTPYIANTLIHGWAMVKNIEKSQSIYEAVGPSKREPSTYEAMTRAFLAVEDRDSAMNVVQEMLSRGYPAAVSGKVIELVGGGGSMYAGSVAASEAAS